MYESVGDGLEELRNRYCRELLIRERSVAGECRGECDALYLMLDEDKWVALTPDREQAAYVMTETDGERARHAYSDGEFFYPLYDAAAAHNLTGVRIDRAYQKRLGDRIELCLEFSNATDLTVHYDLITRGSSRYFIND
ncbi:MAG: hypothetical protein KJO38_02465 [Gammaproteobacteria bacterium]|nr:hypothetical protein [Gammaproteobacteria bacterium]